MYTVCMDDIKKIIKYLDIPIMNRIRSILLVKATVLGFMLLVRSLQQPVEMLDP